MSWNEFWSYSSVPQFLSDRSSYPHLSTQQANSLPTLLLFLLNPLNPICIDQPLLGLGLPWSVVDIPEAVPLRKTNSPSSNHYQIQIAPQLKLGIQCSQLQHPLLEIWPLLACLGLVSAVTIAIIFYVHLPCCLENTVPLKLPTISGSYNLSEIHHFLVLTLFQEHP